MESLAKTISKQSIFTWTMLVLFIAFTVFLSLKTWNIQHSCSPMLGCPDTSICSRKIVKPSKQFCYRGKFKLPELPQFDLPKLSVPKLPKLQLPKFGQ